ncbi:MAG: glutamate-5-semialdehyde dehydrogenase [Myxococcales bacterium]|nr:glutamate-5-semialdehyde dehydrogenase [Myxococcales bacterium]MBK7191666.1 glutamate-5-semialdehyde dehydrogenase [Myxococcales bacterium]MBP6844488.1 glutamate-5-semialdehyde dehydrogenase [Kofleriaceae bacterium]
MLRERQSHLVTEADLRSLASAARAASRVVAKAPAAQRHAALVAIAAAVRAQAPAILAANQRDLDGAAARGLAPAMIDRLRLDERRLAAIAAAVDEIAAQPELIGRLEREETRPNGLRIARMRIPLGVIAIVYEARPNVTVDAAALCLKAGNACILRGGSEAFHSNQALGGAVAAGLEAAGLPAAAVTVVPSTDREAIRTLVGLDDLIDLCIPRGGEGLIRFVAEHARVPVIKHYKGVCHLYVHAAADLEMALAIADNGKTSRPGVCNALETILVDRAIAEVAVPRLCARLGGKGVEIRGDAEVVRLGGAGVRAASAADWDAEYLDLIVAMAVVDDLDAAIAHIERHGSDHTEAIVTTDEAAAARFLAEVGSSTVVHNASTRFADGGELGLGAEIGISTTRLHAYGPMGAEGLTTSKFVVRGTGQIR